MDAHVDGIDLTGELRHTYSSNAAALLDADDDRLTTARDTWTAFVRDTSGDVFTDLALDSPASTRDLAPADGAFVTACYYDFLVDSLLDAVEGIVGVRLENRSPRSNTRALDVAFGPLHDHILAPAAGRERVIDGVSPSVLDSLGPAALSELYRAVVPQPVRLALGEYYTPPGIADLAVSTLDAGQSGRRVLDPGCGAGTFLTAAIEAKVATTNAEPAASVDEILDTVVGIDLNPVAVKSAKLAYLLALSEPLAACERERISVPVFLTDALGLLLDEEIVFRGEPADLSFDTLVGNPPWIPWERLSESLKDAWRETYVSDLGLQPHGGIEARLGHSNDDVSVPYAFTCIHRYLRDGGRAAFVLKRDIVRGPAGTVLRRARVGDRSLRVSAIHDFGALDPFPDASAGAALYVFEADEEPRMPIPTKVWRAGDGSASFASGVRLRETTDSEWTELVALDDADSTSAWVRADLARDALGECRHEIRHGLKDDAAAVFGLNRPELASIEPDRVFPYLRSRHVRKWGVSGHDLRLVPADRAGEDNEAWLRESCPETYAYLERHREQLLARSSSWLDSGPFYTGFGLGPYTWAPYKVVWCRLGFKPDFAVVSTRSDPDLGEKPVVPGDHYMFVATDDRQEAHFLCALLNSTPYQRTLRTLASGGKASLSKSVVSELALPAWPETDRAAALAACSMELHDLVARSGEDNADETGTGGERAAVEARIDRLVRTGMERGEFETAPVGDD